VGFGENDRSRIGKPGQRPLIPTAAEARERITEVIELADHDILDIARSRAAEQEVLDLLDEPPTR
jgi:exonuclease V gamma subunit